jgi:hypothetical protein
MTPNDEATGLIGGEERDAPVTWKFSIDVARHGSARRRSCDAAGNAKGLAAFGNDHEPGPWGHFRRSSHVGNRHGLASVRLATGADRLPGSRFKRLHPAIEASIAHGAFLKASE